MTLASLAGLLLVGWLAPAPWLAAQWPRLLAVGLCLFVFVLPRWFVPARSAASLAAVSDPAVRGRLEDERLKLQNEVRIGLLQALAGVAVIAAVLGTWQQLETDRRQLRQQLAVAGQEQAGARLAQALDQLGSEQLDVRLGGIYGLERIAARASESQPDGVEASQDRIQVFEILAAYVRANSHRPQVVPDGVPPTLQVRQADIQAAATVLARRTVLPGDRPLDLNGSMLPGARLELARFAAADLRDADFRAGDLRRADLAGARLDRARLCGTRLQGADLAGANLEGVLASAKTQWPSGFDWRAAGARLVGSCGA